MNSKRERMSWEEYYFKHSEAIPALQRITDHVTSPRRFRFRSLKFVRPLSAYRHDAVATVWEVEADSCFYAVKLVQSPTATFSTFYLNILSDLTQQFKPYTDTDADSQRIRLPRPTALSLSKVKKDASPFQHELQAYERINKHCPEHKKICFPAYYGSIDLAPPGQRDSVFEGIVMSVLGAEAKHTHLHPSEIPPHLHNVASSFQARLKTLNLPPLEEMWYSQIFLERANKLTILHSLCIIHGDVKNDCFQISHHPHDVALYDFSLAYTFTAEKPCMMNGNIGLIPLKEAAKYDLLNAEIAVIEMAKTRAFCAYAEKLLELSGGKTDEFLRKINPEDKASEKLDLVILLDIVFSGQCFFPSLPSILPFLEPVVSGNSAVWAIDTAKKLESYATIWYLQRESDQEQAIDAGREFDSAVIVASDGSVLRYYGKNPLSFDIQTPKESIPPMLAIVALIPSRWKSALLQGETLCQQIFSLITPRPEQKVLVFKDSDIQLQVI